MTNSLDWGYGCESRDISAKRRGGEGGGRYDVFPPALVASTFALNRELSSRVKYQRATFTRYVCLPAIVARATRIYRACGILRRSL